MQEIDIIFGGGYVTILMEFITDNLLFKNTYPFCPLEEMDL